MTVTTFIANDVRPQIKDETATYRWSDAALLIIINRVRRNFWSSHPEAFYVSDVVVTEPSALSAVGNTLDICSEYTNAFLQAVCEEVFREDADDSGNIPVLREHQMIRKEEAP